MLSVDMPLMSSEFLRWLVSQSGVSDELAIVPQPGGRNQPLCAVYHRTMLPVIEKAMAAREYKVDRVFMQVSTRYLTDSEIHAAGFAAVIFENVNTPEDYELLKRRLREETLTGSQGLRR